MFIADEIQTGFCRTGDWFACEHEGVEPDLITTAKGIAGGLPLAGVTGRAELMDAVHVGGLGGTYGGNPIACAAALAAIETMRELDLAAAARRIERVMLPAGCATSPTATRAIGEVRGRGAMLAIELVEPGHRTDAGPGRARRPCRAGLPRGRAAHADLRHLRQRAALPAAAGHLRRRAGPRPGHPGRRLRLTVGRTAGHSPVARRGCHPRRWHPRRFAVRPAKGSLMDRPCPIVLLS